MNTNCDIFSLTLTLSRWEREQRFALTGGLMAAFTNPARDFFDRRKQFLPLPAGEGRGEGERGKIIFIA